MENDLATGGPALDGQGAELSDLATKTFAVAGYRAGLLGGVERANLKIVGLGEAPGALAA